LSTPTVFPELFLESIWAEMVPEAGAIVVKAIQAIATPVQAEKQEQLRQDRQDSRKDVSAETWLSCPGVFPENSPLAPNNPARFV